MYTCKYFLHMDTISKMVFITKTPTRLIKTFSKTPNRQTSKLKLHAGSWEIKLNVSMNKMNCDKSSLFMHLLIPTAFSRKW